MRPLRLSVPGQFWDSLLYRGRLYLMRLDGVAEVIDWHKAVQSLRTDASTAIAREAAFSRSDFLYAAAYSPVLSDPEIKRAVSQLLQQKLERLAEWELELTPRTRAKCVVASRELPMPFPYADALIYSNRLYVAANDGIYGAGVGKNLRYGISTRPERLWDCPAFGLAASWGHLALAAGEEGLFEHALGHSSISDEAVPVVASHVSSCAYAFQSIYASSNLAEGSLADYHRPDDSQYRLRWGDYADDEDDRERHLLKVVPAHKLFGEAGELSWASQDKLCQLSGSQINVVRYTPWNDAKTRWQQLGIVTLPKAHGEVVSAGVAPFGIVIEQDDALTVLPSQGKPITFPGEVTRWRCFPRSKWYENQLHILYEDRLDVWSFNQDYFVDQSEKLAGTSVSTRAMALEAARR